MFKQRYKNANDDLSVSAAVKESILKEIESGSVKTPKSMRVPYARIAAATLSLILVAGLSYFGFKNYNKDDYVKPKSEVKTSGKLNENDYSDAYNKISEILKNLSHKEKLSSKGTAKAADERDATKGTGAINGGTSDYSKTNTQKGNIDEGDIVKTDGKRIFSTVDDNKIDVYLASGKDSSKVASISVLPEGIKKDRYCVDEMYIYGDKLIVVGQIGTSSCITYEEDEDFDYEMSTAISIYDVKDEKNIKLLKFIKQDGVSGATRLFGSDLYVVTQKDIYEDEINKKDISTFVPKCTVGEENYYVSVDGLYIPNRASIASYAIVNSYSLDEEKLIDSKAVLGGSGSVYLDDSYLVVSDYCYIGEKKGVQTDYTELILFKIDDGKIEKAAAKKIKGALLNQFSMDIYKDHLRVVTTVNKFKVSGKNNEYISLTDNDKETNSVYVLDNKLNITGAIEDLAKDERVYSVRFLGDMGYFVTYLTTDPLFAVDLKDPQHPKILSELKIEGFSSYLHPYKDNELLGLGYNKDENTELKLTMFDISDPTNVKDMATEIVSDKGYDSAHSDAAYDHKAFYFDEKNKQFGFEFRQEVYKDATYILKDETYFVIYKYENSKFKLVKKAKLDGEIYLTRGIRIGDEFYVVTSEYDEDDYDKMFTRLRVYDTEKYELIKTVK